jgi:mono/diheme cytochrome c family protein
MVFGLRALIAVAVLLSPSQDPDPRTIENPVPTSAESLAAGAKNYDKLCALCHGAIGSGDGKLAAATAAYGARPSNLTDDVWDHGSTDGEIFVVIRDGIGPDFNMPGFKRRLQDAEIWDLVNYVRRLSVRK